MSIQIQPGATSPAHKERHLDDDLTKAVGMNSWKNVEGKGSFCAAAIVYLITGQFES
jgi:hypothetical protein